MAPVVCLDLFDGYEREWYAAHVLRMNGTLVRGPSAAAVRDPSAAARGWGRATHVVYGLGGLDGATLGAAQRRGLRIVAPSWVEAWVRDGAPPDEARHAPAFLPTAARLPRSAAQLAEARWRARGAASRRRGVARMPADALDEVMAYCDFATFARVRAASALLDAAGARCADALLRRLLLRRHPILATLIDEPRLPAALQQPRVLLEHHARVLALYEARDPRPPEPKTCLGDYVFLLEILERPSPAAPWTTAGTSAGFALDGADANVFFDVPEALSLREFYGDVKETATQYMVSCMVAQRASPSARCIVYESDEMECPEPGVFTFNVNEIKTHGVANWLGSAVQGNLEKTPSLEVVWRADEHLPDALRRRASVMQLDFRWLTDYDILDMTRADLLLTLEHFCDWQ